MNSLVKFTLSPLHPLSLWGYRSVNSPFFESNLKWPNELCSICAAIPDTVVLPFPELFSSECKIYLREDSPTGLTFRWINKTKYQLFPWLLEVFVKCDQLVKFADAFLTNHGIEAGIWGLSHKWAWETEARLKFLPFSEQIRTSQDFKSTFLFRIPELFQINKLTKGIFLPAPLYNQTLWKKYS